MANAWRIKALVVALIYWRRKKKYSKSVWVKHYLARSKHLGEYHRLVQEVRLHQNGEDFREYFRVSQEEFDEILQAVGPKITREDTPFWESISTAERLAICLRYKLRSVI